MDIISITANFFLVLLSIVFFAFILLMILLFIYLRKRQNFILKANYAESEKKFKSVFESTTDAIIVADHQGIILQWNSDAEAVTRKAYVSMQL